MTRVGEDVSIRTRLNKTVEFFGQSHIQSLFGRIHPGVWHVQQCVRQLSGSPIGCIYAK